MANRSSNSTKSTAPRKPKEKPLLPKIKCEGCFILFHPKDRREKYHTTACRKRHYANTFFKKNVIEKNCKDPECGKPFKTSCPIKQDYCSPECRKNYQLKHPSPSQLLRTLVVQAAPIFMCAVCKGMEPTMHLNIKDGVVLCDEHLKAAETQ